MTKKILFGGVLIDGTSVPPLVDPAVVFEDGRITSVGRARDFGKSGQEQAEIIGVGMGTIMSIWISTNPANLSSPVRGRTFSTWRREDAAML